jgi:serine phosphatase RsbU (regulator of sigma subunit)
MTEAAQAIPASAKTEAPSGLVSPTLVASGLTPSAALRYRFLAAWAVGWAAIGAVVGFGIAYTRGAPDFLPLLRQSVLFAEVVGFTALASARLVFPYFARLPVAVRIALQVLTLLSGTVFGSVAILATQPLYSLARPKTVAVIVLLNAAFAVIVGIALHTYDSMRRQIEESYRVLRQKEAMERDLAIAREVQRELLPRSVPQVRGLQLAGACLPAVGVGGDLYDFLPFAEDRLGLVIADVSGKGIPAALLMAGLQASVRSLALPTLRPSEINRRLNEMLLRSTSPSRYATMFYADYDWRSRTLTYSNAGHYPPLLLTRNGTRRLTEGGLPIGLLAEAVYGEGSCELREGDLLALCTDGILESPDAEDREFGEERLLGILSAHRDRNLEEIVGVVLDEVTRWRGGRPPHDDVTLVLARAT